MTYPNKCQRAVDVKIKIMKGNWLSLILILLLCSSLNLAAQDADATLPNKPAKAEAPKTVSKSRSTKAPASAVKKPVGNSRKASASTPPRVIAKEPNPVQRPRTIPLATLVVSVNPPDSTILLNGQDLRKLEGGGATGTVRLKPGEYIIVASKDGYGEEQRTVNLSSNQYENVAINLTQLPGRLSVTTNVVGAEITIGGTGSYAGKIIDLELVPGRYEITVTKSGYQTLVREVVIEPARLSALVMALEPVKRPPQPAITAMALSAANDGKYINVSLTGSSSLVLGQAGTIEVTLNGSNGSNSAGSVAGLLTGLPCRVDFVPVDNVAEFSFKEPPGLPNQWGRIVVRVRPKKLNRPTRFLINWQIIGGIPR